MAPDAAARPWRVRLMTTERLGVVRCEIAPGPPRKIIDALVPRVPDEAARSQSRLLPTAKVLRSSYLLPAEAPESDLRATSHYHADRAYVRVRQRSSQAPCGTPVAPAIKPAISLEHRLTDPNRSYFAGDHG